MLYAFIAFIPVVVLLALAAIGTKNIDTYENRLTHIMNEQSAAGISPIEIYENIR